MNKGKKTSKTNDYLCGLHAIELCFQQQGAPTYAVKPRELWINGAPSLCPELIRLAKINNIPVVTHVSPKDYPDEIARDLQQYNQLLWIDVPSTSIENFNWDEANTIAIVDHITDTQNLGAIMRSACALGVDALFYPKHTQASITPRVRYIAQGATELLPSYQVNNINQLLVKAQQHGFWVYGLAEEGSSDLYETEFSKKSILIIGSEDCGIRKQTLQLCDFIVKIPSSPYFSCLNAASAASVVFYERHRQTLVEKKIQTK